MSESNTPTYTGQYRHALDDKNRLTIPSAWRFTHSQNDVLVAVPQPDHYIAVLPPPEVESLRAKIRQVELNDGGGHDFLSVFFSRTQQMWCDKAGRIGLNDDLLEHAGIKGEAMLVGSMSMFKIYSLETWKRVQARTVGSMAETMRRLKI